VFSDIVFTVRKQNCRMFDIIFCGSGHEGCISTWIRAIISQILFYSVGLKNYFAARIVNIVYRYDFNA